MKAMQITSHILVALLLYASCIPGQNLGQDLSTLDETGSHLKPVAQPSVPPEPSIPQNHPTTNPKQNSSISTVTKEESFMACNLQYLTKNPTFSEIISKEDSSLNVKISRELLVPEKSWIQFQISPKFFKQIELTFPPQIAYKVPSHGDTRFDTILGMKSDKNKANLFPPILSGLFWQKHPVVVLYLWSNECKFCVEEAQKLSPFAQNLAQMSGVRVAFIAESSNFSQTNEKIQSWQSFMKKPAFRLPTNVFQGIIRSESSWPSCVQLPEDTERPILLALTERVLTKSRLEKKGNRVVKVNLDSSEFVVRQVLKPPFTKARLDAFRSGIQNLLHPSVKFNWPSTLTKQNEEETRLLEAKLLHQKLSVLLGKPEKLSSETLFSIFRLGTLSNPKDEIQESNIMQSELIGFKKSLIEANQNPSLKEIITYQARPYSGKISSYSGMPIMLLVDNQKGIVRQAFIGPIVTGGRYSQGFLAGIRKLLYALPDQIMFPSIPLGTNSSAEQKPSPKSPIK